MESYGFIGGRVERKSQNPTRKPRVWGTRQLRATRPPVLDRPYPTSETEFSMFDAVQLDEATFRVDMVNALRISALRDYGSSAVVILPTLADLANDENFNQIRPASTFAGHWEAPTSIRWSYAFGNSFADSERADFQAGIDRVEPPCSLKYAAHEGPFNLIQIQPSNVVSVEYFPQDEFPNLLLPTVDYVIASNGEVVARAAAQPEPSFDFSCEIASALDALAAYVVESERHARELLSRLYRRFILSRAVSKNGHLSFLTRDRQVRIETAARDQVVHLEVIALAEEHQAPVASAVGQMLITGGTTWKRWRNRLSNLLSRFLRKMSPSGSTPGGLSFESAELLLQY